MKYVFLSTFTLRKYTFESFLNMTKYSFVEEGKKRRKRNQIIYTAI